MFNSVIFHLSPCSSHDSVLFRAALRASVWLVSSAYLRVTPPLLSSHDSVLLHAALRASVWLVSSAYLRVTPPLLDRRCASGSAPGRRWSPTTPTGRWMTT